MLSGWPPEELIGNSWMAYVVGLIRPIRFAPASVNQMVPSGPSTIPYGWALGVVRGNSVIWSVSVLIIPIRFVLNSVNQIVPPGPGVMPSTCGLPLVWKESSVM